MLFLHASKLLWQTFLHDNFQCILNEFQLTTCKNNPIDATETSLKSGKMIKESSFRLQS